MNLLEVSKELFARPFVLWAAAFACGIACGDTGGSLFIVIPFILIVSGFFTLKGSNDIKSGRVIVLIIIILSFLFGNILIRDRLFEEENGFVPDSSLKGTEVHGTVTDISLSKDRYLITVENPKIDLKSEYDGSSHYEYEGKLLIYSDALNVMFGDEIRATGTLYAFSPATNHGQFDQKKYYYAKGIYLKLYADETNSVKANDSMSYDIKNTLFEVSDTFQDGLAQVFDENKKGTLSAMLAGNRSELDENTKDIYKRIGIAHVLSISGLHITLIGFGLFALLNRFCGLKVSVILTLIVMTLYGMLTGFSVSTVRAVIMLYCMLLGKLLGKAYDGQSAAGLAALIILAFNPSQLFESGFLLSFFAVFGIFAGNTLRTNLNIKNAVAVYLIPGISATLATFPIILAVYYSFSPYSFIANPILLPFMSVIVISGLLAGVFGSLFLTTGIKVFFYAGCITGGPADFLLDIYEKTAGFLLELPGSDVICGAPSFASCVIYYLFMFLLIYLSAVYYKKVSEKRRSVQKRKITDSDIRTIVHKDIEEIDRIVDVKDVSKGYYVKDVMDRITLLLTDDRYSLIKKTAESVVLLLFITAMYASVLIRDYEEGFYVSFIDVGQGAGVYMEKDGVCMLADGGSSNSSGVGKYRIEPFLLWKGCSVLDYVLVTHTDEDHISGIKELIEDGRIRIENIVLGINREDGREISELATEYGINVIYCSAGECLFDRDGLSVSVLSPDPDFIYDDKNQASLVARVAYEDFDLLITGDSDMFAESEYVRYLDDGERIDVLQCPHHGSKYSSSQLLLERIRPKVTVISCSKNNVYGHPASETLERLEDVGSDVYVTAKCGMVTIVYGTDGSFRVDSFIKQS